MWQFFIKILKKSSLSSKSPKNPPHSISPKTTPIQHQPSPISPSPSLSNRSKSSNQTQQVLLVEIEEEEEEKDIEQQKEDLDTVELYVTIFYQIPI